MPGRIPPFATVHRPLSSSLRSFHFGPASSDGRHFLATF
jgi:hypothetical protein